MQNSPDIVFSTDAEGRFTFLSDAIERVTGHRVADCSGSSSALIDQTSGAGRRQSMGRARRGADREQQAALVLVGVDGRRVPVDVRAIGFLDDEGSFGGSRGRRATSATRLGSRTSCGGRPASSRRVRSERTWPASCTTR